MMILLTESARRDIKLFLMSCPSQVAFLGPDVNLCLTISLLLLRNTISARKLPILLDESVSITSL